MKPKLDDRINVGSFTNSQTIGIWALSTIGGVNVPSITQVYYHLKMFWWHDQFFGFHYAKASSFCNITFLFLSTLDLLILNSFKMF
jgi:hypothetical protein